MKLAIGYQLPGEDEEPLVEIARDFADHLDEVYFPWPAMPSGRSPMGVEGGIVDWQAQERLEHDLAAFRSMGLKLDLLLNANCYGGRAMSQHLANEVCSLIAYLHDLVGLDVVTTASLMLAHVVRRHFPDIEVRASVNMRIGTVRAMQYVAHLFDSFYIQREYNRDLDRIAELCAWADEHGKRLYVLANSGCLNFCSGQTFHDNLVAHEAEISATCNISDFNPCVCWTYLAQRDNWVALLQNSWIRPEDMHHYDRYFPAAKLATRMHANPRLVLQAYCSGQYRGNLLDLLEPGHGPLLAPWIIDNSRFPSDWFEQTSRCDKRCHACGYCACVLEQVLVRCDG